jgi:hypothetical protein
MFGFLTGIIDWFKGFFGKSTDDQVKEIRELTKQLCSFLPTVDSVLAMVSASHPEVVGPQAIAHAICNVVNAASPTELKSAPEVPAYVWSGSVNGVRVEGERV